MNLQEFKNKLKTRLSSGLLKGMESHLKMSPKLGTEPYRTLIPSGNPKKSAVLVLLVGERYEDLNILFTLRSSNVQHHKHQISFPGGHKEGNEDVETTALREAMEEVGIEPGTIEILGKLSSLYVPPSETIVVPVVGITNSLGQLKINNGEVEEVILHPLVFFLDKNNVVEEQWDWKGKTINVPLWRIHKSVPLWGATAMILSELIDIVNEMIT